MIARQHETQLAKSITKIDNLTFLARAGQKAVFRGVHEIHGDVVVKLYLSGDIDQRAIREMEILKAHSFEQVPAIFDFGRTTAENESCYYLIERFVQGTNLREKLMLGSLLPVINVISLMRQLLDIIVSLESKRIVHRDIKPENIMVDNSEGIWLIDFGIARDLNAVSLTDTYAQMGPATPGYASPEQFLNAKSKVDSRADLFSIGVVAHECLSGVHPFLKDARSKDEVFHHTLNRSPDLLDIIGDTEKQMAGFVRTLLATQVSRRPPNAVTARRWFRSAVSSMQGV